MITKIVTCLSLLSIFISNAQDVDSSANSYKQNTLYLEVFGQGFYNAFSFDRLINTEKRVKNSYTLGVTYFNIEYVSVLAAPVSYNYIFGQNRHHLEVGIGFTAMHVVNKNIQVTQSFTDENGVTFAESFLGYSTDIYTYFTPKIGYRYQKPEGGFFFRFTATPAIAGINKIGATKGGKYESFDYYQYFTNAAFYWRRAIPWAGISFGYTLKN